MIAQTSLMVLVSLSGPIGLILRSPAPLHPPQLAADMAQGFSVPLPNRPDFFEQGREQFEEEVNRLERSPRSNPALTINTDTQQWQPFVFREAGASVWLPLGIFSQEEKTLETAIGPLTFQVLSDQTDQFKFVAAYTELPEAEQQNTPDQLLRTVQQAIVQRTKFALSRDRSIVLDQYAGREFQLQGGDETIIFRIYWADQILYVLGVSQYETTSADHPSETITTFLDSFKLLH